MAFINLTNNDNIYRLKFSLSKDNRNLNDLNEYSDNSFFDVFGFGNTYKIFFDILKNTTRLSKKELSYILRNELKCCQELHNNILFNFYIKKSDIIRKP